MWRACHNLLPTKDNLLRRKIVKEPHCPICGRVTETMYHAMWECPACSGGRMGGLANIFSRKAPHWDRVSCKWPRAFSRKVGWRILLNFFVCLA
jgi:ribosomal protein L37AE/L43A